MNKYYKILGLEEGASEEEIQQAYQKLSNDLDPLKNDNLDFFVEEYKKVQEAYEKLTGKKLEKDKKNKSNISDDLSLINDSDSILSILKKYKSSDDNEKSKIIKHLETHKKNNEKYDEALAIILKKENTENLKNNESKDSLIKKNKRNESNENKSHFSNKLIIGSLAVVVVFFGITYLVFLNKINNFQNSIPSLTSQSKEIQNNSREFWENKFFKDHPEIVNKHLTDNTNKGFLYDENDRTRTKDSIITFMIYSKTISYDIYTPDPIFDMIFITNKLYNMGFKDVNAKESIHDGTYSIRLDNVTGVILDLTYVWDKHYYFIHV